MKWLSIRQKKGHYCQSLGIIDYLLLPIQRTNQFFTVTWSITLISFVMFILNFSIAHSQFMNTLDLRSPHKGKITLQCWILLSGSNKSNTKCRSIFIFFRKKFWLQAYFIRKVTSFMENIKNFRLRYLVHTCNPPWKRIFLYR